MESRENKPGERRRARRVRLQAGVQIASATVHGEVVEVSRSGLAFSYLRDRATRGLREPEGAILFGSGRLYLSACVIVPVREEELAREAEAGTIRCRCGVRFHGLSPGQERDLGRLIRAEADPDLVLAGASGGDQEEQRQTCLSRPPAGVSSFKSRGTV